MQPTDNEQPPPGQSLAVVAEALYLVNLLLLPGFAFIALLVLYWRHVDQSSPLARCHLEQTLFASLWAGVLLILANIAILLLGGYDAAYTWVVLVLYFTVAHTTLVILGTIGLARAMAGKPFEYPLIGKKCHGL
ncbi:hypothetical protein [Thiohalophilus sp.]|uniref:hypothetical protein n=1 Tax=Thiohalophilus sp. TaxID=3028392 RepID=UPI002ACE0F0C|nr:hypothetical protein [Thiohalophilus sp.]MDZ7660867.1 hypothetical protein [Thiohalophilus sp.]